jgi:putative redox protein
VSDTERIDFTGALGQRLAGRLHRPAGPVRAYALFAHCFTCSKDLKTAVRISSALAEHGIATLRFDFTGLGESEGDFADTNFSSNIEDLVKAADMLRERFDAPAVLIGHSLGGAAVLAAAQEIPEAKAVATIGAPADPAHVRHLLGPHKPTIDERGEAEVILAGRQFRIRKQFLDDLEAQKPKQRLARLDRALLLFHAPGDEIVGIDNARQIYEAARHPKSFVSLEGADHLLTREGDAEYVAIVLAAWAHRYIPPEPRDRASPAQVEVRGGAQGLTTQVRAGRHTFAADEPESVPGGHDTGPDPYGLLLGALGSCTVMTLRMYADRKGWALDNVRVQLEHHKVHADDCGDCESRQGKVDELSRLIFVDGDLDDEQRRKLLEIADKCPVHKTLVTETKVRSRLDE